jgi:MtaA/CmuA family methyltransferase
MNSFERFFNTLNGKPTDSLPVTPICMTFAAKVAGVRYGDYCRDYKILAEAQLKTAEQFDLDVLTLCSDPAREAADCGAPIRWFDDQPPAHAPDDVLLANKSDLLKLRQPDPLGGGRMHDRVKAAAYLRERVNNDIPILGWIEGPMAEAADLRGINNVMYDTIDDPNFLRDLFEFILEMEINFAKAQVEAGVHIMGIGDAASSLIGPDIHRELVLPYQKRMVSAVKQLGVPVRLHICGNITHLLDGLAELGVDMIDVDYFTDVGLVREKMGPNVAILGNVEPVRYLLEGTPEEVYEAFKHCHQQAGARYVVGPGCEVPPNSPHENVRAMVRYARSAS